MVDEPEPMKASHAYMIVAAALTVAITTASGRRLSAEEVWNRYIGIYSRVRRQKTNPVLIDRNDTL